VGRALFRQDWCDSCLEKPTRHTSEMRSSLRSTLRRIFAKPDMAVTLVGRGITGNFSSIRLTPEDIHGGGLTILLSGNVVQLARFPDEEFSCFIDCDQLASVLDQFRPSPSSSLDECRAWFSNCVAAGEPTRTKAAYTTEANKKFGVSARFFHSVWKEEVGKARLSNPTVRWGNAGRPRGRQKS
jgi:hypothetical protein